MYKSLFLVACAVAAISSVTVQAGQIPFSNWGQNLAWIDLGNSMVTSINDDDPLTTFATVGPNALNATPSAFAVAEGNFGATDIGGQSFLATKAGRVGNVHM